MYGQQRKWTLDDCINYATEHSVDILKSKAQTDIAAENIKQQQAAWLPTLSANTSQSVTYRPFQEGATGFVNGNAMTSSAKKTSYNGSYGINAAWTVYNGNQTANNIKLAKLQHEEAELKIATDINSIKEQIVQLYINIMYTREALEVNKELLAQDSVLYKRGVELLAQGQIAKYELLELQSTVANGKYDIVNTATQIDQYLLQLKKLLSLPSGESFDVADLSVSDAQTLAAIPETQSVYAQALAQRPEIKTADLSIKEAELNYKVAKAGYLPTVSMSAGFGDNHSSGSDKDWFEQMKRNLDGSVGLTVSIPIFDGRKNKTNTRKAKIEQTIANLDKEDASRDLYYTIANYRLNAFNNQQKYIAGTEKLNYNQENYNAIYTKAQIGTMNIVETLNARTSLLNAKQDVLQSKYLTAYNRSMLDFYANDKIDL
jgi:outer membrane protein